MHTSGRVRANPCLLKTASKHGNDFFFVVLIILIILEIQYLYNCHSQKVEKPFCNNANSRFCHLNSHIQVEFI